MIWNRFELRQALYLAFCGTFVVIARAALRLHLHITGHSMFFNLFFLMLARGAVRKFGAATLAGLLAGLLVHGNGFGKGRGGALAPLRLVGPGDRPGGHGQPPHVQELCGLRPGGGIGRGHPGHLAGPG
jgi:hypothetical protein